MATQSGDASDVMRAVENIAGGAAEQESKVVGNDLVELSTGVVLEIYAGASIQRIMDIDSQFPAPPVPTFNLNGREEENPSSPIYQAALKDIEIKKSRAAIDSVIVLSTRVKSIPENFQGPEDEEWLDALELMGYTAKTKISRYLHWVKFKAGPTDTDIARLSAAAFRRLGVREEDVSAALDSFQDNSGRNTAAEGSAS